MDKKFEVGKRYECANFHMHPITILSRTKKNITVDDGKEIWGARAKIDEDGYEYIQKSFTLLKDKGIETYSSEWEIEGIIS